MTALTAFDADVIIYAAAPRHVLGTRVRRLIEACADDSAGCGSLLLLTEVLAKPLRRDPQSDELSILADLLGHLDLYPVDESTARLALTFAVAYGLRVADATHLAAAVVSGAERFITNNRRDFPKTITEIQIVYPDELPAP
ncbi:PIN domain-containing protein [Propionimicrobium sp. PCR01-08-3]|uniref:type II toxin-antitoxin system VapC family toxin n=1 Tax=Propionimicrobium sp. PCR01-08-3 TaxID=3052086 RepID=UPI00255CB013|nr:PIN domain-containing protein [Propionimicrobium sp. PCR01-08-3]WIY83702.1 PIN domain-containing protein [Propionimicrobium sp. PCR01-08-3]